MAVKTKAKTKSSKPKHQARLVPVLVTTEHRGVFFGYADPKKLHGPSITLTGCRNCLWWSRDVKGFLGLASNGPTVNCRIGPPTNITILRNVTSVSYCSSDAVKAWEAAPWAS